MFEQVDRRSNLSLPEFLARYLLRGRPVVLTDAFDGSPARSGWSFDRFARYADTEVNAARLGPDAAESVPMRLGELLDGARGSDVNGFPFYLRDWIFWEQHPELLAEFSFRSEFFLDFARALPSALRLRYPRIFIGPKGASTPLHWDIWESHAWLSQLVGAKRWLLYPPGQIPRGYLAKADPEQPDLGRFPKLMDPPPLEAVVGPGDTVFVPSLWSHKVSSLSETISITYNFAGPGCLLSYLRGSVRDAALPIAKLAARETAQRLHVRLNPWAEWAEGSGIRRRSSFVRAPSAQATVSDDVLTVANGGGEATRVELDATFLPLVAWVVRRETPFTAQEALHRHPQLDESLVAQALVALIESGAVARR